MESSAHDFTDRYLIFQYPEVSAFSAIPAYDSRAFADPAGIARRHESTARIGTRSGGVRPGSVVLLRLAYLSPAHHGYRGLARLSPTHLARHCHSGFRAKAVGVWTRSTFHLRDVDFGRGDFVSALLVVHELPQ